MKKTKITFEGTYPGMKGNRVACADGDPSSWLDNVFSWLKPSDGTSSSTATSTDTGGTGEPWWGHIGSWFTGIGSLVGGIGTAIGASKGTGTTTSTGTGGPTVVPNTETKSNTKAWIIGGVVGLAVIAGLIFFIRKKK